MRARRAVWALALVLAFAGCATRPAAPVASSPAAACSEARLRGIFRPADPEERARRFRVAIRRCGAASEFEVRGRIGPVQLAGSARDGELLLLFPRHRRFLRGRDEGAFWQRFTGLPLSAGLVTGLVWDGAELGTTLGDAWTVVESEEDEEGRVRWLVRGAEGELELRRIRLGPTERGVTLLEAPPDFRELESGETPLAESQWE